MSWLQTEYILKGVFLALLLVAALLQGMDPHAQPHQTLLPVNLAMLAGLGAGLVVGAILKLVQGYRPRGPLSFLLFILLECPTLIYLGILGGLLTGIVLLQGGSFETLTPENRNLVTWILGGGALLGFIMGILPHIRNRNYRIAIILILAAGLVAGGVYGYGYLQDGNKISDQGQTVFALQILIGLPFFYLLTFAGHEEESEVEIGAISAALGISLWILWQNQPNLKTTALVAPALLYVVYTFYILPGLRVYKHAFRGYSYSRVGRYRLALLAFRRALQLDPTNKMARDGFWDVHKSLDMTQLAREPQLLALVDFDLCMERAGSLLVNGKPTPAQLDEALRLLELVLSQRPQLRPTYDYWRAVASTHQGNLEDACERLTHIIDPTTYGANDPARLRTLMPAWQLALLLHPTLRQRVGEAQLAIPGRRMEAIAAVERVLAETRDDAGAIRLKQELYRDLREAEYLAVLPEGTMALAEFDHEYARHLGLARIVDAEKWQHGAEFLRLASRGLPLQAVGMFVEIAKAQDRAGNADDARSYFERARNIGREIGFKNLPDDQQRTYFATVKYLGELALHNGQVEAAIENYKLFTESPSSGIETLRTLADLYEQKQDILSAIRATDAGLIYNSKDADLLAKKDRFYYSLPAEVLQERVEEVSRWFDTAYCLKKARSILEGPQAQDLEWLDVARHLSELAMIVMPTNVGSKLVQARVLLRYGERDRAIEVLEDARANRPTSWLSGDEEDAWYQAQQILGDLYMEIGRADAAIPCYQDFLKSHRAGAKTHFKLGQAWEQLGETAKAVRAYKQVTAYEGNPLSSDAYDALHRLGA